MILLTHIVIALIGLLAAIATAFKPSAKLVGLSIVSITATVTTGTVLVLQGSSLLHVCIAGLLYTAVAGTLTAIGSVRLRQLTAVKTTR